MWTSSSGNCIRNWSVLALNLSLQPKLNNSNFFIISDSFELCIYIYAPCIGTVEVVLTGTNLVFLRIISHQLILRFGLCTLRSTFTEKEKFYNFCMDRKGKKFISQKAVRFSHKEFCHKNLISCSIYINANRVENINCSSNFKIEKQKIIFY